MNNNNTCMHAAAPSQRSAFRVTETLQAKSGVKKLFHPLFLILTLQAGLSLSLVWSNTAFGDEGEYLWAGHLEIAHWLHGIEVPSVLPKIFSGSPLVYPPIGAIADSIGGLTGARLLSLGFMLATSVLLFQSAARLVGQSAATFSTMLWSISEPAIRLGAYATFDAMSVFLTALSVWLLMRSAVNARDWLFALAAALTLAAANATAYSGVSIDPVVIVFAAFAWTASFGARRAVSLTGLLIASFLVFFAGIMGISHSWTGIMYTVFLRGSAGGYTSGASTYGFILKNVWIYSGLYLVLSIVGLAIVILTETGVRRWLLVTAGAAVLVVPAAQLHDLTEVSLDKHLAYGIWFGSIVCGYGCQKVVRSVPGMRAATIALCSALALAYPASDSWRAALDKQQSWANATDFVDSFRPVVARAHGTIYASTEQWLARYYTPQGFDWTRWNVSGLPLGLPNVPVNQQRAAYIRLLDNSSYGVIALFYQTTVHGIPSHVVLSPGSKIAREEILSLISANNAPDQSSAAGKAALTVALEADHSYRLVSVGPYNSGLASGIYAIWERNAS